MPALIFMPNSRNHPGYRAPALAIIVSLALLLLWPAAASAQDTTDLGGRALKIATENAYPPFNFIDPETGEAVGWEYDLLREICARLNCVAEFHEQPWAGMLEAVASGEYDLAADGISITAERAEIIAYSQPYLTLNQRLLLQEGEERFASWEEFRADEQLLLGAQGGTTDWQFAAEELGEARLIAYDSTPAGIQGLIAGEIAALLLDDAVGAYFAQQQPGQLRLLPDELAAGQDIGLVFPPGSALIAPINAALSEIQSDGTLSAINEKWLGMASDDQPALVLPDLGGRVITVGVENSYPPFNQINPDTGEAEGWDYDVLRAICELLNCVPEFLTTNWEAIIISVAAGEFDMVADGISITAERQEIVDFSDGYLEVKQTILKRIDDQRFGSYEELLAQEDLLLAQQPGTTQWQLAIDLFGAERVIGYESTPICVLAVLSGDLAATIIHSVAGQGWVDSHPEQLMLLPDQLDDPAQLAFLFPKGSELVPAINAALAVLRENGYLEERTRYWFSR